MMKILYLTIWLCAVMTLKAYSEIEQDRSIKNIREHPQTENLSNRNIQTTEREAELQPSWWDSLSENKYFRMSFVLLIVLGQLISDKKFKKANSSQQAVQFLCYIILGIGLWWGLEKGYEYFDNFMRKSDTVNLERSTLNIE